LISAELSSVAVVVVTVISCGVVVVEAPPAG
jgi:hypothetical protein